MKLDRTSILYGTMLLTATGLLNQVLGFFYRILLSRLVGAEIMGLYQLVMPVYSVLLSVTAVGLTAAVSNLTSEYRALGNWTAAGQVLRRCLVLLVALLYSWWKKAKQQKNLEAEQTKKILETDLNTFEDNELKDLENKYK